MVAFLVSTAKCQGATVPPHLKKEATDLPGTILDSRCDKVETKKMTERCFLEQNIQTHVTGSNKNLELISASDLVASTKAQRDGMVGNKLYTSLNKETHEIREPKVFCKNHSISSSFSAGNQV